MDPVFAIFALAGVAGALRFSRLRNTPSALLAFCWTVVTVLALCAFQAKHLPYIVFLLPPLCILGALCGPAIFQRPPLLLPAIVVLFSVKAIASGEVWSLRPTAPPLAGAAAMRQYCNLRRDVELISVQPDDEFYSATLRSPPSATVSSTPPARSNTLFRTTPNWESSSPRASSWPCRNCCRASRPRSGSGA